MIGRRSLLALLFGARARRKPAVNEFPGWADALQWALEGARVWEKSQRHKNSSDPDASTSSTASVIGNGGELRKATTICLPVAGTVSSDGLTCAPVSCTVAKPSDPAICTAIEPESNGIISLTLPLNCTKATSIPVDTYVNRSACDSAFQRLIDTMACSTDGAMFLCMAGMLSQRRAGQ